MPCATRSIGAASPQRRLTRRRQHRDGQVPPGRAADAGAEGRGPARGQLGELHGARENDYPAGHFTLVDPLQRPAEHHPVAAQRARGLGRRDDDGGDRAVALDDRMMAQFANAQPDRDGETGADHRDSDDPGATAPTSAPDSRRPLPHRPIAAVATIATATATTEPPTCQRIPAAVTAQLVSAAGTSRRSRRAAPVSTDLTHGRGHAASPAAPARCRRRHRAGRRW